MINMKSREKRFSLDDLYEIAKKLVDPGEEAESLQYTKALIRFLASAEGLSMAAENRVKARLGL